MAIFCMGEASCVCGWWNFLVIVRSYYTLRGRKMQLRTRKDKGRGLAKKGGVVGSGGGFAPIRSAANLPSRVCGGSRGGDAAVFRAAWLFFSAPLGCSPLRSLSQSPRLPEGRLVARGLRGGGGGRFAPCPPGRDGGFWEGRRAMGGRQAVASLPGRRGGDGRFGSMDGWGGGRRRSLSA